MYGDSLRSTKKRKIPVTCVQKSTFYVSGWILAIRIPGAILVFHLDGVPSRGACHQMLLLG